MIPAQLRHHRKIEGSQTFISQCYNNFKLEEVNATEM
jgi:hypothetical protein